MKNRAVLFVDDEENILKSIERGLRKEEYRRFYACDGFDAQKIICQEDINIIITDMNMPGMDGLTLLKWVEKEKPDIIRMILSMKNDTDSILEAINNGNIYRYIIKPCDSSDLNSAIKQSLEVYDLKLEKQKLIKKLEEYNKTLEQEVDDRTSQLLAIKSEAEIGKHTSQIVHNLNNYLSNILGSLDLMGKFISEENTDLEKAREFYKYAISSTENLGKVVAEILIRARNGECIVEENVDINQLIEKAMLFWNINPTWKYKIKKELRLASELPPFTGSQIQIKQILDNLIKNSIDAMENSENKVLRFSTGIKDGNILVEISDTGDGISQENIQKVFSPGYTSKPIGKGTGLGLASVKTMVEAYSGSISIDSKPGEGTTVSIRLPI